MTPGPGRRAGHGWWPYLLPLFSFLVLGEIQARTHGSLASALFAVRALLPGVLVFHYARLGHYPELRGLGGGLRGATLDVLVGVAGALVWVAPYVAVEWSHLPGWMRPDRDAAFDPQLFGASVTGLALTVRVIGFAAVVPFAEELFMRSWLMRYLDVFDGAGDFRDVPIASFSRRSFLGVLVFFTIGHVPWEWPVALLWVLGTQLWFYHRRHLMALVIVHAASNLSIFLFVVLQGGRLERGAGGPLDLWFLL